MTRSPLPADMPEAAYYAYRKDASAWLPAVAEVARREGLTGELAPVTAGSNLIAAVGPEAFVKLYPPVFAREFDIEREALGAVQGRIGVAVPEVLGEGRLDGWPYLVLRRVAGIHMVDAWTRMDAADRRRVAAELGEAVAHMHRLPVGDLPALAVDWPVFVRRQAASAVDRQRQFKLAGPWLEDLARYVAASAEAEAARPFTPVLLHADLTDDNVLVTERDGEWHLSGVIDFADAMAGPWEYELVAAGIAALRCQGEAIRHFLLAYGLDPASLDATLRDRAMLHCTLHRFGHLPGMIHRTGLDPAAGRIAALAEAAWAFGEASNP